MRTSSMHRLRGSFRIRSRKRASARRVRSSPLTKPFSRPLAAESPFTGTIAVVCKWLVSAPTESQATGCGAVYPPLWEISNIAGAKCRGELEGSLRQSPASLPAHHEGRPADDAHVLGRRIGVLRITDHAVDEALVERGDALGGRGAANGLHEVVGRPLHDLPRDVGAHRHDRRGGGNHRLTYLPYRDD